MTMQQNLQLTAFPWRPDWFPPNFYIRVCPRNGLVDTMDVFTLVSSSHGAAKTLRTKFLGARVLEETKQKFHFTDAEYRNTVWNGDRILRKTLPIDIMIAIVKEVHTPTAVKLIPDLKNVIRDVTAGSIVLHDNNTNVDTQVGTTVSNAATTTTHEILPCFKSQEFHVNPYNSATSAITEQVRRAQGQFELQKVVASAMEHGNNFKRREELSNMEHSGKKARIIAETEHQEWKLQLARLNEKYEWATSKNKVQLADCIQKVIEEM